VNIIIPEVVLDIMTTPSEKLPEIDPEATSKAAPVAPKPHEPGAVASPGAAIEAEVTSSGEGSTPRAG
jgi:hypothetical protein